MIDFILIQDAVSGIGLFKFKGKTVAIDPTHEDLFNGFMSAFQGIIKELKLGNLNQISTTDHHCIFHSEQNGKGNPYNIIIMFDCEDCVEHWKEKAKIIGCEFIKQFGNVDFAGNTSMYTTFRDKILEILEVNAHFCTWD